MKFHKYVILEKNNNEEMIFFDMLNKHAVSLYMPDEIPIKEKILDSLGEEEKNFLINEGFIVGDEIDDLNKFENTKRFYQYSNKVCRYVIHLNYDCNLTCGYCYQNIIEDKLVMTELTMRQIINFIKLTLLDYSPEIVDICFIGGEPMLYAKKMKEIMECINREHSNVYYSIVTNGTIMRKSVILELIDLGLYDFTITLDGPREIHNQFRVSKNGRGSYDKILNNLLLLQSLERKIHVNINCNLNTDNIDTIHLLLDDLRECKISYPVIYSMVLDTATKKFNKTIKERKNIWLDVHELSNKYGYQFAPFYREVYLTCSLFQKNNYSIGADGYIYSCIEAVGSQDYRQAHVSMYKTELFEYANAQFCELPNKGYGCDTCEFLPVCDGGCLYKKNNHDFICPKVDFMNNDKKMLKKSVFT